MFKSWKTTLSGIAAVITGVVAIASGETLTGVTAIITGIGLIAGKDFNVTGGK